MKRDSRKAAPSQEVNLWREKPILFSAPMVRAILAGRKTQTRRILDPQPPEDFSPIAVERYCPVRIDRHGEEFPGEETFGVYGEEWGQECRYGEPGTVLWVREAWRTEARFDDLPPRDIPPSAIISYEADCDAEPNDAQGRYRHGRFMPRAFSRISLEITGIRVERLRDISEADAIAEGIEPSLKFPDRCLTPSGDYATPCVAFQRLWESINGPESWAASPWVWVISFRVIKPEISEAA